MITIIALAAWFTFCGSMFYLILRNRKTNPQAMTAIGVACWSLLLPFVSVIIYEHFQLTEFEQWVATMEFIVSVVTVIIGLPWAIFCLMICHAAFTQVPSDQPVIGGVGVYLSLMFTPVGGLATYHTLGLLLL